MITLIAEHRGTRRTFVFEGDSVAIGRGAENDLRVGSRYVSTKHCRIEASSPEETRLVDLGSQNGTRVNGEFAGKRRLKPGDRVDVGPVVLWFDRAPAAVVTSALSEDAAEDDEAPEEDVVVSAKGEAAVDALESGLRALFSEARERLGDSAPERVAEATLAASRAVFGRDVMGAAREARRVVEINRALNSTLDVKKLIELILDAGVEITRSERGFLLIRGGGHKVSHGIAEEVAKSGETLVAFDAHSDGRFAAYASVSDLKLRSVLCVPLKRRDEIVGVLYLDNRFHDGLYGERERRMIEALADQAVIALENARLHEEAESHKARALTAESAAVELERRLTEAQEPPTVPAAPRTRDGLRYDYAAIVGESPALISLLSTLDRVVESDLPVLITGESGVGKELLARAVHLNSIRKHNAFVRENCAAIPETLLESELFGYRRGAFTGAQGDKRGLFEEADRGTIFLDEIGEMSLAMQAKLMRVLQDGEIRPVGARESLRVDVRVISATNKDLRRMAQEGRFRDDLYFRLNVVNLHAPPLRERPEDVDLLVGHFLERISEKTGSPPKAIEPAALRALRRHAWPGNIRELQNEIRRAHALSGDVIRLSDLAPEIQPSAGAGDDASKGGGLKEIAKLASAQKERELILQALETSNWRKSAAARKLGVSRPTLDLKIKQFGLQEAVERGRRRS
jgi:serine/threonine-protein kinase PknK